MDAAFFIGLVVWLALEAIDPWDHNQDAPIVEYTEQVEVEE